jgi:hypothetical protein
MPIARRSCHPLGLPIPYVPPTDLHKKWEMEQIKVELPDGTKFQMPTYETGNNEEYLVHVITILHLGEQKGTANKVKEAFAAFVAVRKEMSPLLKFPDDETVTEKEARKKNKKIARKPSRPRRMLLSTGPEGLRAVQLLCCWQGAN